MYKVDLFDFIHQKRYYSSKILVVVTQVRPSVLSPLINMTSTSPPPTLDDTQMSGSNFDPPTTDQDDDDDTTIPTGFPDAFVPKLSSRTIEEVVVKLSLRGRSAFDHDRAAERLSNILSSMKHDFSTEVTIYSNVGPIFSETSFSTLHNFKTKFDMTETITGPPTRRAYTLFIILRIHTSKSLSDIRNGASTSVLLKQANARFTKHPWLETQREVVSMGFITGFCPRYQTSHQATSKFKSFLVCHAKLREDRLPKFALTMATVKAQAPSGVTYVCSTYELQVQRQDVDKMRDILSKVASHVTPTDAFRFVSYRMRHSNPSAFAKFVHYQAKHVLSHRIIAIQGLNPDRAFHFTTRLSEVYPEAIEVLETHRTHAPNTFGAPIGRYNVLCKETDFVKLARSMTASLATEYDTHKQTESSIQDHEHMQPIAVISRFPKSGGSTGSNTTRNSLESTMAASIADYIPADDEFPEAIWLTTNKVQQASTKLPSDELHSSTTPISEITYATIASTPTKSNTKPLQQHYDTLTKDNANLKKDNADLQKNYADLMARFDRMQATLTTIAQSSAHSQPPVLTQLDPSPLTGIQLSPTQIQAIAVAVASVMSSSDPVKTPPRNHKKARSQSTSPPSHQGDNSNLEESSGDTPMNHVS